MLCLSFISLFTYHISYDPHIYIVHTYQLLLLLFITISLNYFLCMKPEVPYTCALLYFVIHS